MIGDHKPSIARIRLDFSPSHALFWRPPNGGITPPLYPAGILNRHFPEGRGDAAKCCRNGFAQPPMRSTTYGKYTAAHPVTRGAGGSVESAAVSTGIDEKKIPTQANEAWVEHPARHNVTN